MKRLNRSSRTIKTLFWSLGTLCLVPGVAGCTKQEPALSVTPVAAQAPSSSPNTANETSHLFQISTPQPAAVAVGQPIQLVVRIKPLAPYKINLEYPARLRLRSTPNIALAKAELGVQDAAQRDKGELRFEPNVTLAVAGEQRIEAEVSFSVCTEAQCELAREKLSWAVKTQP